MACFGNGFLNMLQGHSVFCELFFDDLRAVQPVLEPAFSAF